MERLVTLTGGDLKLDAVMEGLRKLKMKLFEPESHASSTTTTSTRKKHLWLNEGIPDDRSEAEEISRGTEDDDMEPFEQALQELEPDDEGMPEVSEEGAKEILMTLIKQKISRPQNMQYKQMIQQKKDVRNSRGYRPVGGNSSANAPSLTMRRDLQQLKAVTKCKSCGLVGHWHRECPNKHRSVSQASSSVAAHDNAKTNSGTSHSWWSVVQEEPSSVAADHAHSLE